MRPGARARLWSLRFASVPLLLGAAFQIVTVMTGDRSASRGTGGVFATAWCGVFATFTAFGWLGPMFQRRLIRDGNAVVGTVSSKRRGPRGRCWFYEISYQFKTGDDAEGTGIANVAENLFERLREHQTVLVFYQPFKPSRSVLYDDSDYEIVADPGPALPAESAAA